MQHQGNVQDSTIGTSKSKDIDEAKLASGVEPREPSREGKEIFGFVNSTWRFCSCTWGIACKARIIFRRVSRTKNHDANIIARARGGAGGVCRCPGGQGAVL